MRRGSPNYAADAEGTSQARFQSRPQQHPRPRTGMTFSGVRARRLLGENRGAGALILAAGCSPIGRPKARSPPSSGRRI